jgi:DsbC/DsbD-like thiol-disulfide interchange protein
MERRSFCLAATALALAWVRALPLESELLAQEKKLDKSDAVIKVAAKASKPDADGKQTVTLTIQIDKGWHIYANPVGDDTLKPAQTVVTVTGKEKLPDVKVDYPAGKVVKDDELKIEYKVYEDKVEIKVNIMRAKGDAGPLTVAVKVMACNEEKKKCLLPATVTVPVELLAQVMKSDAVVKVTARGSKLDADGKQTVTVTIQIDKGWHIYANPVGQHFEGNKTVVTVTGKEKLQDLKVEYPTGKLVEEKDLDLKYRIYEGTVEIKAHVQRAKGDTGPLQVSVRVRSDDNRGAGPCLLPATVQVPVE